MQQEFYHHRFDNGLVLVAERMPWVNSAAFTILVPSGAACDPPGRDGLATMLADLVFRGAGRRDSRQVIVDLDNLGTERAESVQTVHTSMGAATLADHLADSLAIYADIVRRPWLPAGEVEAVRALALQELQALEDEPRQKVMVELRRRHFPYPLGRPALGTAEGLQAVGLQDLQKHHQRYYQPDGAIVAVAGRIDWPALLELIDRLFGDWPAQPPPQFDLRPAGPKRDHIHQPTTQTQIGIAYRTVPYRDQEYFLAQAAVSLLSGGSSSRLFSEVRERRGLCYAVFASYHSTLDEGAVVCYAGTTSQRAADTLAVTLGQIQKLAHEISDDEVARVQAGLKSALIMQGESSSARSAAIAADWFHLQRVRTFEEVHEAIEQLSPESIGEHLRRHPPRDFTILTLGPEPLATAAGPN